LFQSLTIEERDSDAVIFVERRSRRARDHKRCRRQSHGHFRPQPKKNAPNSRGRCPLLSSTQLLPSLAVVLGAIDLFRFAILFAVDLGLFLLRQLAAVGLAIICHLTVDLGFIALQSG